MINYTQMAMALGITTVVSTVAVAAGNTIDDTHYFRLGVLSQTADITVQSTVDPRPPIEIDLIDDLGMDDKGESFQLYYRWRFADKWSLGVTYQRLELDGNGEAAFDFNFDGKSYTTGAAVETDFSMDTYLVDLGYSIVRNDKWEVTVGAGLHAFDFEAVIAGTIGIEGGADSTVQNTTRAAADVLAPLPNLRGGLTYLITPRWEVKAGGGWLSLEIDDIDGSYTYVNISTEYRFTDRFGLGAAYQIAKMDVTSTNSNGLDKLDAEFAGPSIYLSYGF
ncbi:MAG: hypothetical protein ACI8QT_001521 [Halioglobus sp.]|jgi:hypothetical protein